MKFFSIFPLLLLLLSSSVHAADLNTSSDKEYRSSIKKITNSMSLDQKKEFESAVASILTDGHETQLNQLTLEDLFVSTSSGIFGAHVRKNFLSIGGMSLDEINAMGKKLHSQYKKNIKEKKIQSLTKEIKELHEKKQKYKELQHIRNDAEKSATNIQIEELGETIEGPKKGWYKITRSIKVTNNSQSKITAFTLDWIMTLTHPKRPTRKPSTNKKRTDIKGVAIAPGESSIVPCEGGFSGKDVHGSLHITGIRNVSTEALDNFPFKWAQFTSWDADRLQSAQEKLKKIKSEPTE